MEQRFHTSDRARRQLPKAGEETERDGGESGAQSPPKAQHAPVKKDAEENRDRKSDEVVPNQIGEKWITGISSTPENARPNSLEPVADLKNRGDANERHRGCHHFGAIRECARKTGGKDPEQTCAPEHKAGSRGQGNETGPTRRRAI